MKNCHATRLINGSSNFLQTLFVYMKTTLYNVQLNVRFLENPLKPLLYFKDAIVPKKVTFPTIKFLINMIN